MVTAPRWALGLLLVLSGAGVGVVLVAMLAWGAGADWAFLAGASWLLLLWLVAVAVKGVFVLFSRVRDYVAAPDKARAWEWEKARDTVWLKARIQGAGYSCTEVDHAYASLYGGAAKSVQVSCDNGEHRYAISEGSVREVG